MAAVRDQTDALLEQALGISVDRDSFEPGLASTDEIELRRQLCAFIRRGCRQRLLISTEGRVSARLGDESCVITPTLQDRDTLEPVEAVINAKAIGNVDPVSEAVIDELQTAFGLNQAGTG